jgi:hypothetical protein
VAWHGHILCIVLVANTLVTCSRHAWVTRCVAWHGHILCIVLVANTLVTCSRHALVALTLTRFSSPVCRLVCECLSKVDGSRKCWRSIGLVCCSLAVHFSTAPRSMHTNQRVQPELDIPPHIQAKQAQSNTLADISPQKILGACGSRGWVGVEWAWAWWWWLLFTHTLTHTHTHSPRNCCHRGVLVERTVKEVKPAVEENKERIGQVRLSATSPSRSTHRPWCTEVTKAAQRGHDTLNHCVPPTCHTLSRQNHHHTPWALTRNPNPRAPVGPPPPPHTRTHTHTHTHTHTQPPPPREGDWDAEATARRQAEISRSFQRKVWRSTRWRR